MCFKLRYVNSFVIYNFDQIEQIWFRDDIGYQREFFVVGIC